MWGPLGKPGDFFILEKDFNGFSLKGDTMGLLQDAVESIKPLDKDAMGKAKERQDFLTKPAGSLGVLEDISIKLAGITGSVINDIDKKTVVVMAGDHGVVDEG